MSDQQQGSGWWQASDGKWYPPESAPGAEPTVPTQPVPPAPTWQPTQTWATPGPLPPSGPSQPTKSKAPLLAAAAVVVLALLVGGFFLLKDDDKDDDASTSNTTEQTDTTDGGTDTTEGGGEGDLPDGFEVLEGDGVSIAAPEGWQVIGAEDFDMTSEELAQAFPDAPEGMIDQGLQLFQQGAVLVAFDLGGGDFSPNVNVIDIPGEAPLDVIESQAVGQLDQVGGDIKDSGTVNVPLGEALRILYTLDVALPDGSSLPAQGVQYYLPVDGHTYIVTVSTGGDADELGSQMIDTFQVG